MHKFMLTLSAFLFMGCGSTPKSETTPSPGPETKASEMNQKATTAPPITKDALLTFFQANFPKKICDREFSAFFLECFSIDEAACQAQAKSSVETCIAEQELADEIPFEEVQELSEKLGTCAGGDMETKLTEAGRRNVENDKCNSADAWQKDTQE